MSHGPKEGPAGLLGSLRAQTLAPSAIRVWHNGPTFPPEPMAGVELHWSGEGVGYGEGVNRLVALATSARVLVATDDLILDRHCIQRLAEELDREPRPVVVAPALRGPDGRVNAFGLKLTNDWLGVNVDRGRAWDEFQRRPPPTDAAYLGPSGALFALDRDRWAELGGGAIFPRSFFLYMEDTILGVRLRLSDAVVRFRADAFATHTWSVATGRRGVEKLRLVERNRLWLLRSQRGRRAAVASLPWTVLRYASYLGRRGGATAGGSPLPAFARAVADGLGAELPEDVRDYLAGVRDRPLPRQYFAPLREQLRDPVR